MNNIWEDGNQYFDEDREAEAKEEKMDIIMKQFNNQVQATAGSQPPVPESTTSQKRKKKPKRFRSAFTTMQITAMENEFKKHPYINHVRRQQLADELKMSDRAIKVWFQNRRMKEKRDMGDEESGSSEEHIGSNNSIKEESKQLQSKAVTKSLSQHSKDTSTTHPKYSIHISTIDSSKTEKNTEKHKLPITHTVTKHKASASKDAQDKPENLCIRKEDCNQEYTQSCFNQSMVNGFMQGSVPNNMRSLIYPSMQAVHPMQWNRMNFVPIMQAPPGIQMCSSMPQMSVPTGAIQPVKKCSCDCHFNASAIDMNNARIQPTQPFMYIVPQTAANLNHNNVQ